MYGTPVADPIPLTCAELSGSAEEAEEDAADGGRGNLDRNVARMERSGAVRPIDRTICLLRCLLSLSPLFLLHSLYVMFFTYISL